MILLVFRHLGDGFSMEMKNRVKEEEEGKEEGDAD